MIKVIRMLYDGTRARAQLDDAELSAWFHVCRGLRQGCVSSPPPFIIFSVVLVNMILPCFVVNPAIASDLVFFNAAPKGGDGAPLEETPLGKMQSAVWGTLFAVDATIVFRSTDEVGC